MTSYTIRFDPTNADRNFLFVECESVEEAVAEAEALYAFHTPGKPIQIFEDIDGDDVLAALVSHDPTSGVTTTDYRV